MILRDFAVDRSLALLGLEIVSILIARAWVEVYLTFLTVAVSCVVMIAASAVLELLVLLGLIAHR